ncbi:TolC family protein [Teredinibacter turnerae]|uniref:TolC family protein n=1 Tax=Teredinibacter turnerae TaxID=2426 RepID=UPI00036B018B|nr:TolC family protein [Teredinibacter turnerae]
MMRSQLQRLIVSGFFFFGISPAVIAQTFTLEQAVNRALLIDPWVIGSEKRQESLEAMSVHAGALPDPTVSLSMANLPIDSFDFSQEGMTQFKVGVSQMIPRGKTRTYKREKLQAMSEVQPHARAERKAKVASIVSQLWLEIYRQNRTIELIEKDRHLFEHLVDVSQSSYTTTSGRARQQDLVRAQLELTRLDDRLTRLRQKRDTHISLLGEWLQSSQIDVSANDHAAVDITSPDLLISTENTQIELLSIALRNHPMVKATDQKIVSSEAGIALAKQSYKPQWGVNASYGYRDDDPLGQERTDFFSAGISFDVPLFTKNRQDKVVKAAKADREYEKTERALVLRKLRSGYESAAASYHALIERQTLFDTRLLKEMSEQAEASLTAYTNDDGDFAEVVRARIAELNARIEALNVDVDIQKTIAKMNYFLAGIPSSGENNE